MEINLDDKFCEKLLDCLTSISNSLKDISAIKKMEHKSRSRYDQYMSDVMEDARFFGGEAFADMVKRGVNIGVDMGGMPPNNGSPVFPK